MQSKLIVGVDVSKLHFSAAVAVGEREVELGEFANDEPGYQQLHEHVQAVCDEQGLAQVQLVLEPTGGYEAALVAYAHQQHWLVSLPNPKQVRDWAKGVGYRVKTDPVDARLLAHYGRERQPPTRPPLPLVVSELDSLLKRRRDLEQALQCERTRLSEMGGRPGIAQPVYDSLAQVIAALEQALADLEAEIERYTQSHATFAQEQQRLLALPGVGAKLVLPLLVKLCQWQTLTQGQGDAKGLTAYVGLDPQFATSGTSLSRQEGISKQGDREIRRLLYMGALGGVRGHNPLRSFYQRLLGRGKPKQVALVAAARKLLVWAWTIFSRQTHWNPAFHQS